MSSGGGRRDDADVGRIRHNMAAAGALDFSRRSVAEQAAAALRAALRAGELADPLPGEHELARRLGISRPSVRLAVAQLAAEKLVRVQKGRRTRLVGLPAAATAPVRPTVCVVAPSVLQGQPLAAHPLLLHLRALVASRGIRWEEVRDAKLGGARPERRLAEIVGRRQGVCWILFSAPEPVQRWFAAGRRPALVVGSAPPGLALPSVDVDFRALGRHAAGAMLARGHRRLALIIPENPMPGDTACRDGFREQVARRGGAEVSVVDVTAGERADVFKARLDAVFGAAQRPTAVLGMRSANTLAFYVHALERGWAIPDEVSVVSRDTHPLLEASLPALTRYGASTTRLATRAVRLAEQWLAGRRVPAKASLVTPAFIPGGTLARR